MLLSPELNSPSNCRDVLAGVALSRYYELTLVVFGEFLKQLSQQLNNFSGSILIILSWLFIIVGEPSTCGLVNIHDVCNVVPGPSSVQVNIEFIVAGACLSDPQWPVFEPEPKHTGGAGSSIDPQYERDCG